jgi:hypothetical protein
MNGRLSSEFKQKKFLLANFSVPDRNLLIHISFHGDISDLH